jgi:predicted nucleic acid-binding protein
MSRAKSPPLRSSDAADDYLIGLAAASDALLVSGDEHLLELADRAPIHTPAEFADMIESA